MSREIEFRAWDSSKKQMLYQSDCYPFSLITQYGIFRLDPHNEVNSYQQITEGDFELMQYSGLKDKDGQKIYEGDIVKHETETQPMLIGWNKKFASFILRRRGWAFDHFFGEACNSDECEVVGNIYENPNLLQEEKKLIAVRNNKQY